MQRPDYVRSIRMILLSRIIINSAQLYSTYGTPKERNGGTSGAIYWKSVEVVCE